MKKYLLILLLVPMLVFSMDNDGGNGSYHIMCFHRHDEPSIIAAFHVQSGSYTSMVTSARSSVNGGDIKISCRCIDGGLWVDGIINTAISSKLIAMIKGHLKNGH